MPGRMLVGWLVGWLVCWVGWLVGLLLAYLLACQLARVEHQKLNQTTPYGVVWLSFMCSTYFALA